MLFSVLTSSCPTQVLSVFRKVFGEDFEPYTGSRQFHTTPLNLQVSLKTSSCFSLANVLNRSDRSKGFPLGYTAAISLMDIIVFIPY